VIQLKLSVSYLESELSEDIAAHASAYGHAARLARQSPLQYHGSY